MYQNPLPSNAKRLKYQLECEHCGAQFQRKSLDSRTKKVFCSFECYRKDKKKIKPIACAGCGVDFEPTAKGRPFCSRSCYDAHRANDVEKVCVGCGATFSVK